MRVEKMSDPKKSYTLVNGDPQGGPPPSKTGITATEKKQLIPNFLLPLRFGIAIGFSWAVIFVIISVIVWISKLAPALDIFSSIYPGFKSGALLGIIIGFAWSLLYGLIFGFVFGRIYNCLATKKTKFLAFGDPQGGPPPTAK